MSSPNDDEETGPFEMDPKLKAELEAALRGELETCLELEQAMRGDDHGKLLKEGEVRLGDMGAVEFIWRAIADGRANLAERDIWVQHVAQKVVDTVISTDANKRGEAALKALGFTGVFDKHREAREELEVLLAFAENDGNGQPSRRQLAQHLLARGYLKGKSVTSAMKVVDRLRLEIRQDPPRDPPEK